MSMGACLTDLVTRKVISEARAAELRPIYDELVAQYEPKFGRAAAESMATEKAMQAIDDDFLHRKRMKLLQAKAQGEFVGAVRLASTGKALDPTAAHKLIERMDVQRNVLRGQAHAMIDGILAAHRRTITGAVREREALDRLGRELFGQATDDVNARELADAFARTGEYLRMQFNAAGGRIGKLDRWAVPQSHDSRAIRRAGFETWRDELVGRDGSPGLLDRARMIDRATGEPMSDGKLESILKDMWEVISSGGWSRTEPGAVHVGALANRRGDHRVLHFRDYDAWSAYADKFGGRANLFDAMLAHIEGMTRDIAAMRAMGPNPNATVRLVKDTLEKSAMTSGDEKAIERIEGGRNQLQRLYDAYTGASNRPENERLALVFGAFRAQQVAAKLGSATLSAVSDFGFMIHTSRFNRTPVMGALGEYLKLMRPGNMEDRRLAVRLGLIAEEWSNMAAAQQRFTGEELAGEVSRRMADFVLRASYLSAHTQHMRWAFGMEQLSMVAQMRERAFGALEPGYQRMLNRYGIDERRWDAIRATATREERGADWIFPEDIADRRAADLLMEMVLTETDYAVPSPTLKTRAFIQDRAQAGSWKGEMIRSAFLFKGFPLGVLFTHGERMLEQTGGWNKARYGLWLMALLTAGGAVSLQLKELARGRDPKDMNNPKFLGAAALQGGGLGIFGDFLASDESRFGGGFGATLLGPLAQSFANVKALTTDNLIDWLDGDESTKPEVGKDAARLLRQEVPGSSLWYTRLAYERMFADQVETWIDPKAAERRERLMRKVEKEGGGYWAPPGTGPEDWRAPDWSNAMREPEPAAP